MANPTYLTREQAVAIIEATNGKLFSVEFTKRTTGETRRMTARLGVRSHLRGGSKGYDAKAKNLITCFDMHANGYRNIAVEGLTRLLVDGTWRDVVDAPTAKTCCSFPQFDGVGACDTCGKCW
jgi:hypothetical protein